MPMIHRFFILISLAINIFTGSSWCIISRFPKFFLSFTKSLPTWSLNIDHLRCFLLSDSFRLAIITSDLCRDEMLSTDVDLWYLSINYETVASEIWDFSFKNTIFVWNYFSNRSFFPPFKVAVWLFSNFYQIFTFFLELINLQCSL